MKYNKRFLFCVFLSLIVLSSCRTRKNFTIVPHDPMKLVPGVQWAVVIQPYVAFREDADVESKVMEHGRKGDFFCITGKKYVKDAKSVSVVWYSFDQGWLKDDEIAVYDNEYKARTASKQILE